MSKLENSEVEKKKWRDRISKEVKLAVKVQENFLPKRNLENYPVSGINIAAREISSPNIDELISLDKSNSLVRGFDITSAFLQQETIKVEAQAKCDNGLFQSFKSIDLRYSKDNKEKLFFYTNEWLKKQQ